MEHLTKMFPLGTSAAVIELALAEVGTVEEGDNLTKYGEFTKANGLPWCGSFVNWVFAKSEVKIPSCVSTALGAHKFKEMNRWSTTPQLGYLAFMDFPHDGVDRISHVGIVVELMPGNQCMTIEGNTSGTGDQRNGGQVCHKVRAFKKKNGSKLRKSQAVTVVGFGKPVFKS